jgi:secreted trypsin-like serine protease
MRRQIVAIAFAMLAVVLVVAPAAAVTGGRPDNGEHPHVGMILAPAPEGGFYFCSGTLIAPTVVLTAAHCTWLFSELRIGEILVSFDDQVTSESTFYASHEWYSHPDYVDTEWPFTVDVGVVILGEAIGITRFGVLPGEGLLNELIPRRGEAQATFVDVGYGQTGVVTGGGPPQPNFPLERRQSTQRYHPGRNGMVGVAHGMNDLLFMLKANPSSRHGSGCGGDSGGPIFLEGSDVIVAIHTGGYRLGFDGALCGRLSSLNHRIDTPIVLDWLGQFFP